MRSVIASLKMLAFVLWCLLLVPPQALLLVFYKGPKAYAIPFLWERGTAFIFGLKAEIAGMPVTKGQVFYFSNHLSYLDVPLLGGIIPRASFVAKSEVASWPVFGFLSTLQQTEFIERERTAIARESAAIAEKVASGRSLIIFPEGTSTSGLSVEPFKSSLFTLALGNGNANLQLQPVTISILTVDGHPPRSKEENDLYAWPRDMEMGLGPHLWRFAKTKGARLRVTFHPALRASAFTDRKTLANTCHDSVSKGLYVAAAL